MNAAEQERVSLEPLIHVSNPERRNEIVTSPHWMIWVRSLEHSRG
jgi:hypothetical protein